MTKVLSQDEQLKLIKKEFSRCKEDPIYFTCRYIKVVHPVRGLVNFELYPFQKRILNEIQGFRFNILRKFRQAGCTTLNCAYALWFCIFHPRKTVAVLSKGDAESTEFLERVKTMYDELPVWLKPEIKENNKHTVKFANGSILKSRSSGRQAGRSLSSSLLIIDEAAFIENMKTIWAAAYPTISTGGKVVALSTVNGIANWFFEIYSGAIKGTNSFHAIDIHWKEHPEYFRHEDYEHLYEEMLKRNPPKNIDNWEKETRGNLKPKEWKQEFEAEFLGTGDTYVDGETLEQLVHSTTKDFLSYYNGRLRVFQHPRPERLYCLAADSSLGRGYDHSAFHVFDLYTGVQVAEFYSESTPLNEFAKIIAFEGRRYNTANVIVERNMIGHVLIRHLMEDHEYDNMWNDEKGDIGILISSKNRETLLADMEELLRMGRLKIRSERTIFELMTFIINEDTHKPEADEGKTDDLVMSLAFAAHLQRSLPVLTELSKDKTEFSILGISTGSSNSTYKVKIPTKNGYIEEDYSWILRN